MTSPRRLQTRILIPFVGVAIASVLVLSYVALALVSDAVDSGTIAQSSERAATIQALGRTLFLTATWAVLLMVYVSKVVSRRVTAPIESLVAFTRRIAGGSPERAPSGDDEIGRLGHAFNDMMDRLDQSRAGQVQSEKLALAGLMAARVAHDIRNPLASIKMRTQVLAAERGRRGADRSEIDAILGDIQQLETVVQNLIDLARPGQLRREPTPVSHVIDDVLHQLGPQLSYRKIAVRRDLADGPLVSLDSGRFRQVLLNVIGNASDAMPDGGTIVVRTAVDDDRLVLDIIDDGMGIDPVVRDRLFDPFVSTKRDGVGLGLVNAKAVVEHHGGTITLLQSKPKGTRARITLPLSPS
jgi:signal transduction histidine kinase